eukprot:674647-Amorphochlora_amoeboformis.AAC.1
MALGLRRAEYSDPKLSANPYRYLRRRMRRKKAYRLLGLCLHPAKKTLFLPPLRMLLTSSS